MADMMQAAELQDAGATLRNDIMVNVTPKHGDRMLFRVNRIVDSHKSALDKIAIQNEKLRYLEGRHRVQEGTISNDQVVIGYFVDVESNRLRTQMERTMADLPMMLRQRPQQLVGMLTALEELRRACMIDAANVGYADMRSASQS